MCLFGGNEVSLRDAMREDATIIGNWRFQLFSIVAGLPVWRQRGQSARRDERGRKRWRAGRYHLGSGGPQKGRFLMH